MYPYFLVPERGDPRAGGLPLLVRRHHALVARCHPSRQHRRRGGLPGAGQNSTRIFVLPTALGLDVRMMQRLRLHLADRGHRPRRDRPSAPRHFQERAGYYYQNWDELYGPLEGQDGGRRRVDAHGQLPATRPTSDPIEVVTEARGRSDVPGVIENYHRLIDEFFVVWQYHFEFLNLGYGGYIAFFQFCKQAPSR